MGCYGACEVSRESPRESEACPASVSGGGGDDVERGAASVVVEVVSAVCLPVVDRRRTGVGAVRPPFFFARGCGNRSHTLATGRGRRRQVCLEPNKSTSRSAAECC